MKLELAREVLACLPKGRTLYHYTKDDYAFFLLKKMSKKEQKIRKLKETHARKLLEKPSLKPYLSNCSNGVVDSEKIPEKQYLSQGRYYRLSLDIWGDDLEYWRYNQVSRKGVSVVLQLNLTGQHQEHLSRCMKADEYDPFENWGHPARSGAFPTLSWCRLDFDLEKKEALVEEIQTDLIRDVRSATEKAYEEREKKNKEFDYCGAKFQTDAFIDFWKEEFSYYEKIWNETMLSAALWFLTEELGMRDIYYHTHASGSFLKRISGASPPKSIYTKLPKQFCFEETTEAPELLRTDKLWKRRERKVEEGFRFFRLSI